MDAFYLMQTDTIRKPENSFHILFLNRYIFESLLNRLYALIRKI